MLEPIPGILITVSDWQDLLEGVCDLSRIGILHKSKIPESRVALQNLEF